MIDVTIHDAVGKPVQTMTLLDTAEADQNAGPLRGWVEGRADLKSEMVDVVAGLIVPRPVLSAWPAQMQAPATLDMTNLPAGAVVRAANEAGEAAVTDDPADPIALTGAGDTYSVNVDPPWPWIPLEQMIEVV